MNPLALQTVVSQKRKIVMIQVMSSQVNQIVINKVNQNNRARKVQMRKVNQIGSLSQMSHRKVNPINIYKMKEGKMRSQKPMINKKIRSIESINNVESKNHTQKRNSKLRTHKRMSRRHQSLIIKRKNKVTLIKKEKTLQKRTVISYCIKMAHLKHMNTTNRQSKRRKFQLIIVKKLKRLAIKLVSSSPL